MPQTMEALRKLAFELRLLWCAQLLQWTMDAVPKRRVETMPVIAGIGQLATTLGLIRYASSSEAHDRRSE